MAVTTDTVMNDTVPVVLERARFTERFASVMAALVWRIRKELHDGKTVELNTFGTVTANNLTEGIDMVTSETMSDTRVTITPAEVGTKIILTDKLVRDDIEDVKAAAGRILGEAMAFKRDRDLLNLLDTAGATIGAGGTMTLGQVAAARAIVRGNPVSSGGPWSGLMACVQHPYVLLDLVDVLTPLVPSASSVVGGVSGELANQVIANYNVGRLFGMPVIEAGNIDTAVIVNTAKGGVFAIGEGSAIVLATANEWSIEPERDASLRATELNVVGEYGVGYYESDWAVELNHDATLPA